MTLLNLTGIASGAWVDAPDDAPLPEAAQILVSFERLIADGEELLNSSAHLGLRLKPHNDVGDVAQYIGTLSLIVIDFPVFTDGRGYSQARRLREEFHFRHELRADGDILPDQARFLERCGFDTLVLAPAVDIETVRAALRHYSFVYQPAADDVATIQQQRHERIGERKAS